MVIVGRWVIKMYEYTKNLRFDNTLVIVEVSVSNCAIFVQIGENRKISEKCKLKCLTRACGYYIIVYCIIMEFSTYFMCISVLKIMENTAKTTGKYDCYIVLYKCIFQIN